MTLSLDILRQLPKAELHCHLDGFCRPETIVELAHEQGVKLPTEDLDELKKILTAPFDCPDLPTYLRCFDAPLDVMQYPYAITRILYEACEDAVKDGITYLELRFAPALHTRNGHSYSQILEAAIDGAKMAEMRLPITVRIICCAMRQMSPEVNKQVADVCWRFRHSGVVGFDLAGPEFGFPPQKHIAAFRTMREKSVSLTIHAGEAFGAKSVEYALACNANRIGHGTRVVEDPKVLQVVIDRRVPLEMCVTSNYQTKAVTKLEEHPIKKLFDLGVITVPCTDNPTVSGCTLSGEYELIQKTFGFSVEQLVRMMDYGFRSAFVDETLKRRLRIEAITKTIRVLKENNIDISGIVSNFSYYLPLGITIPNNFTPPCKIPELTLDLVKSLKKADCDTRFIGSVPIKLLYKFYEAQAENERIKKFESFEEFQAYCISQNDPNHIGPKALSISLLQTEENIRQATKGILQDALEDNVEYIEIGVSPLRHIQKGLTTHNVVDYINDEIKKFSAVNKIIAHLIITVNVDKDSPLDVQQMAELCVEYKDKNVVGFATNTKELDSTTMPFFQETFNYLRRNFISVSMFAGEEHPKSIPIAIVRGNARRISGAFQVAESTSLLNEVTSHGINVLCASTPRMSAAVDNCFAANPMRSFFDFGVKVSYCSIHNTFAFGKPRCERLYESCKEAGLDTLDLLQILSYSYGAIFEHYAEIKKLQRGFWEDATKKLEAKGYKRLLNPVYFV